MLDKYEISVFQISVEKLPHNTTKSVTIPLLSITEKGMMTNCLGRGIITKIYDLLGESSESSIKRLEA